VPGQIAVLLALTAELFDRVPIDQMTDAEHAVQEAAANIPAELTERFNTADKLSDEDRAAIIQIARNALIRFQPKSESKPQSKAESEPEAKAGPELQGESKPVAKTEVKPKPKPTPREQS
jgi:F-type H+-transporting ATPase subunit alpha